MLASLELALALKKKSSSASPPPPVGSFTSPGRDFVVVSVFCASFVVQRNHAAESVAVRKD